MTLKNCLFGFILAFLIALFVTVISPFDIYVSNPLEYSTGPVEFLLSSFPYFLGILVALFVPILLPWKRIQTTYLIILTTVLSVSVVNTFSLFGYYGEFDGRGMNIDLFSMIALSQIVVLGLAIYLSRSTVNRRYILITMGCFLLSNLMINVYYFYDTKTESSSSLEKTDLVGDSFSNLSKDQPNYLYIILDQVHGRSAKDIFENSEDFSNKFAGFINYTNTVGVFPTTIMSVPAILTGEIYDHSAPNQEFIEKAFEVSPLLDFLQSKGFDISVMTKIHYKKAFEKRNIPMLDIGNEKYDRYSTASSEYVETLNLSIFKAVPDFLKSAVYRNEDWLFSASHSRFVSEFQFFAKNMRATNPSPTFRFFHTLLTHTPINHDKGCQLLNKTLKGTYENYMAQDICGFGQVGQIIDRLKELGIYDNTYIIISSDHGRSCPHPEQVAKFGKNKKIYGEAHALLMVKPFNSKGSFQNDSSPVSLLDISPIILASINNTSPELHPKRRKYHSYVFNTELLRKDTLPPYEGIWSIGEDVSNPSDWSETTFQTMGHGEVVDTLIKVSSNN